MKRSLFWSVLALVSLAGVSSCVVDKDYEISDFKKDINTELNLMGDGLEIPIGKTEQIHISDALKIAKDSTLTEFLKTDDQGRYSISASGNYDMTDVIDKMELDKLLNLDGASYAQNVEYPLSDFDKDQFTIKGQSFDYQLPAFESFDLDDIKIPSVKSEQKIATELYKFRPDILDLGGQLPKFDRHQQFFSIKDIDDLIPTIPGQGDTEIDIQAVLGTLGYSSISFSQMQEPVDGSIGLGEKASLIADVDNFKLQAGGQVKIALSILNCPLTKGQITPNIKASLASMIYIDGESALTRDIDLSSFVLSNTNGWSSEHTFTITGLVDGFPSKIGDEIAVKGSIDLNSGSLDITNAKSTKNKVSSLNNQKMTIHAVISFNDVILESMDITLGNEVKYDVEPISMPLDFSSELPKEIEKIDKIVLDQAKTMLLEISADNISGVKAADGHLSIAPEVEIEFPEGLEVTEADVNRKIVVTGDLYDGKISKTIHITSLVPTTIDGTVGFSGNVKASIKAQATGKFNTKNLPKNAASDVVVKGNISCEPKIADFNAKLNLDEVGKTFSEKEEFSFDIKGMGDFGEFEIYPKTACKARLELTIPELTELQIVGKNVIIGLPEMLVVDSGDIPGYNPADNSITINGQIPELIEIPIKYLKVKPTTEPGGVTKVKGYFTVDGVITVDKADVTNISLKEMSSKQSELSMVIPTIEAGSISLSGDFSKSLDYECKDVVFLDKTAVGKLPKEVKVLKEVEFKSVNAIVQITLIGLPTLKDGKKFHLVDTKVDLPEFLTAHDGGNTIEFDKDILVENDKAVITKAVMGGIKDVTLEGLTELKGDIVLHSSLYSEKPDVDLATLEKKISGSVKVALGDGTGVLDPGKIAIEKALVSVKYEVEEKSDIKIGNVPEELQGEDVNLALSPEITINLKTNFGAPLEGNFTFVPYIKGEAVEDCIVNIPGIKLPVSEDAADTLNTIYKIGAKASSAESGVVPVVCDLSPLMKRIPDEIKLYVNATIDPSKNCVIYPSATYVCKMDYDFSVPISFGKDFNVGVTSLSDIDASISDYLKMGPVRLNMEVVNILPVGARCDVKLIDDKGAEVPLKSAVSLDIKPGDGNTPNKQEFHPELNLLDRQNPVTVKQISLDITMDATPDVVVSKDQYLQVTKMTAMLPEGILYNLENQ